MGDNGSWNDTAGSPQQSFQTQGTSSIQTSAVSQVLAASAISMVEPGAILPSVHPATSEQLVIYTANKQHVQLHVIKDVSSVKWGQTWLCSSMLTLSACISRT